MALPKPPRPEYSTTIPSTGKKIKYQPFSVKEEKILVLAAEGENLDEISNAIGNVLTNCITTPGVDVQELALFDIEFLFLRARAKSIGEKLHLQVTDPEDNTTVDVDVNIDSIKVERTEGHDLLIKLSDDISIKMKYPDLAFFAEGVKVESIQESTETISRCVSQIVIGEEVHSSADMTTEEIVEWIDGLTTQQFRLVMAFFETMPKLRHTMKLKNPNTGESFTKVLEGLADFF